MVEYSIKTPIVIDNGSGVMKAGLGGEDKPALVFNSYVGKPKHQRIMINAREQDLFIGQSAEKYKGVIKLNYPIEHGVVKDWDEMEAMWRYIFDELKVNPREHRVLLTEPPLNPLSNRIRTAQLFFETFGVPYLFFQTQAVLSLYARGKTTGVVLDCGDGVTHCSAIYEGYSITNATQRIDLGGRDVTAHLMKLLRRAGYAFHTTAEFEIVRQIKEKYCYVEPINSKKDSDFNMYKEKETNQYNYTLPDGNIIKLGSEKQKAPEILFKPELIGLEYPGVHEMVATCIQKCDIDLRKTLYGSIIVAGSTSLMNLFCERLHKQIQKLVAKDVKPTLIAPNNRQYSCWIGGGIVSSLKAFNQFWISKKDFEEDGRIFSLHCM